MSVCVNECVCELACVRACGCVRVCMCVRVSCVCVRSYKLTLYKYECLKQPPHIRCCRKKR